VEVPQSDRLMSNPFNLNLDVTSWTGNVKVPIPIVELAKIPSVRDQIKFFLGLEVMNQSTQVVDES